MKNISPTNSRAIADAMLAELEQLAAMPNVTVFDKASDAKILYKYLYIPPEVFAAHPWPPKKGKHGCN